ncbi:MAG: ABC transporter permease [Phycisphaerales bacterium]
MMTDGIASTRVLTKRELLRLVRQPSRLLTALLTPVLFWLLAGAGLDNSFVMPGASDLGGESGTPGGDAAIGYASYLLPGMATMVVMFASVIGAISLIQDRHAGFLQSVLVSPAPRWSVVVSKIAGGGLVAVLQAALLIVFAMLVGLSPAGVIGLLLAVVVLALTAMGVIGVGLALAWKVDSIGGFHGVMNMVLLPMWVLSGALFPASGASGWLAIVMWLNPLHWATLALGGALGVGEAPAGLALLGGLGAVLFAGGGAGIAWLAIERSARRTGAAGER